VMSVVDGRLAQVMTTGEIRIWTVLKLSIRFDLK